MSVETAGRTGGLRLTALAVVIGVLVALPLSRSDRGRSYGLDTVYPLMLLPLIAVLLVAGVAAWWRPASAHVAAVVTGITGIQVLGIAVVASRDWRNFAGVDFSSWERGHAGSIVAVGMFFAALGVVLTSCALYRGAAGDGLPRPGRAGQVAAVAVAVGVPVVLSVLLNQDALISAGQFALWWSLPWGAGLLVAGSVRAPAARRAALGTVLLSVAVSCACAAASPMFGFGLRLPES